MSELLWRLTNEREIFIKRYIDKLKSSGAFEIVPESSLSSMAETLIDATIDSVKKKNVSPLIASLNSLNTNEKYLVSAKTFLEGFYHLEDTMMSAATNVSSAKLIWRLFLDVRKVALAEALNEKYEVSVEYGLNEEKSELKRITTIQRATIESIPDGILVVDRIGKIVVHNQKFLEMWGIPAEIASSQNDKILVEFCMNKLNDPQLFVKRIEELYEAPDLPGEDFLELKDGRIFHRSSRPEWLEGEIVGRIWCFRDVTEQKNAVKALEKSEKRFRELSELIPQTIFEIDPQGMIIKAGFELFGYTQEDFLRGVSAFDCVVPEEHDRLREDMAHTLICGRLDGSEYKACRKDGSTFPAIIYSSAILDNGKHMGFRGILTDISNLKATEDALRQSEKIYRSVIENIQDVFYRSDREGRVLMGSPSGVKFFGYDSLSEMIGLNLDSLWVDPAERQRALDEVRAKGWVKDFDALLKKKDGTPVHASLTFHFYKDDDGNVLGTEGIIRDITKRKQTEEALRESTTTLESLINATKESLLLVDREGNILVANETVAKRFGKPHNEIVGTCHLNYFPEDIALNRKKQYNMAISTGQPVHFQDERAGRFYDHYVYPVIDDTGQATKLAIFAVDITDLKLSERALQEREARLKSIFAAAPVGISIVVDRIFEEVNDFFCNMLGYTREELLHKNARMLYKADDEYYKIGHFFENISSEVLAAETQFICKNGTTIDVLLRALPLDPSDTSKGMTFVVLDITEQKKIEKTIRESEERYHRLVETSPDAIVMYDINGNFVTVNQKAAEMYGVESPEQFLDTVKNVLQLIPDEERPAVQHKLAEILKSGRSGSSEYVMLREDGSLFPAELNSSTVVDREGKVNAIISVVRDISERKAAEKALYESESKFRDLVEKSMIGVYIVQDGIFKYVNSAAAQVTGYTSDEIIDKLSPKDIIFSEDWPLVEDSLRKRLSGEIPSFHYEFRLQTKKGDLKNIEVYSSRTIHKGKPAVIGSMLDITERKQSETKIIESEQALKAILSASPIGIGLIQNTVFEWVNDSMCHITGYSFEELIGKNTRFLYPDEEDYTKTGEVLYTQGQSETRWITKEGLLKDIFLQIAQSSSSSFIVTASDITEIKKAQNDLSVSESRFRAIIDSAQDAIYIKDQALRYIVANPAMGKLFGMSYHEILGKRDIDIFDEATGHQIEEIDRRVLGGEIIKEQTERIVRESKHIFDMIKVPLRNEKNEIIGLCGIARDITERKNLEFQLAQSQKIEAIGTLAGGIAHDFNNIIGAIMGYASLLQLKMDHADERSNYVAQILSASEKAANLTQSLLAFSRKQLIRLKPVRMNEVIENILKILARLLTEDIEFKIELSKEELTVLADEGQIDQVIMNLVTNARDAMPRGGSLTITTSPFTIDDEFIRTRGFGKKGQYGCISVIDTGKGIDPNIRAKIFEPFFTTKEVGKGTGLGLSLVYGIVKQHNGFIEVDSKINHGTVFHIYLPLTHDAITVENMDIPYANIAGGTETILVAEDNEELADVVKTVLADNGYSVILAKDGLEAVSFFKENMIDLAILDVVMPKKNGWEVYEELKKSDSRIKVLFVSGYTDDIIQEKGLTHGGIDLVLKPLSPHHLLAKVREILDRKS